jgi:hypothetical protein
MNYKIMFFVYLRILSVIIATFVNLSFTKYWMSFVGFLLGGGGRVGENMEKENGQKVKNRKKER